MESRLTGVRSYEVLSDSNKRPLYDQMGKAGLEGGGGMGGGMDPQDLFSQLFGGGGGFFGGGEHPCVPGRAGNRQILMVAQAVAVGQLVHAGEKT